MRLIHFDDFFFFFSRPSSLLKSSSFKIKQKPGTNKTHFHTNLTTLLKVITVKKEKTIHVFLKSPKFSDLSTHKTAISFEISYEYVKFPLCMVYSFP